MEILRALGALAEVPRPELAPVASGLGLGELPPVHTHTELFGFQLVPFASIYLNDDGGVGGEARDRIFGFWRAIGREPAAEADHLTLMLASWAELCDAEREAPAAQREAARHHRRVFLNEHLLSWLPAWLLTLDRLAPAFSRSWGALLAEALRLEGEALAETGVESMHHRLASPFPDADASPEEFLGGLLAPVRSGILLSRRDLSDAAGELGIASRMGERRYMLEAMLSQRPSDLLGWLVGHCERSLQDYASVHGVLGKALEPWSTRAEATRDRLRSSLA